MAKKFTKYSAYPIKTGGIQMYKSQMLFVDALDTHSRVLEALARLYQNSCIYLEAWSCF